MYLYPFAKEQGFVRGKANSMFVPFSRVNVEMVHWFEIQWDKSHRPYFVVNFCEFPFEGTSALKEQFIDQPEHRGEDYNYGGRLQRSRGGGLYHWFSNAKPLGQILRSFSFTYTPEQAAGELIDSFGELEAWWESKLEDPHIYIF